MDNNETRQSSSVHAARPLARIRKSVKETVSGMRTLLGQINVNRSTQQLRDQKKRKRKVIFRSIIGFIIIAVIVWLWIKIF
jgi:large-conductance mechanosensitive channel